MRYVSLLLVLACTVSVAAQDLTVERIMQDPDTWIGAWPKNPRWSESGDTLYFEWNPSGRFVSDSLFSIPRSGGEPVQVPAEKRRRLGPVFNGWHHGEGLYDESFRRKVYEDGGDIYVYDRTSRTARRLTQTRERERDPRFVQDGIVYRSGNNLFVARTDGARRQLTDLRPGTEPSEPERDSLLYEQ
ncbi:MAG: S9 family peptidase, partial [Rhodothermales bacterium]